MERKRMPQKRIGQTWEVTCGGQTVFVRSGEYDDGTIGEVFVDMHKEGAAYRSLMNCFAIAISLGLQYGVPLSAYVRRFVDVRFEPNGLVVGHGAIKSATSVIDLVFRVLGEAYGIE